MTLRIFNTLSGQKELFKPVHDGKVGIYLCGPTVYKSPHIGHMVGPITFDAIKRYLTYLGYKVTWIVNITDVEDKLIAAAEKQQSTVQALAEKYEAEYHECLKLLGVDGIDAFPRASDHIGEIIKLCETLIARGHAYAQDGNVWFNVAKDSDYGKLSHRKPEDQEAGTRELAGSGKKNPSDFGLWKAAKPGEPFWESPWGKGRPGWHIECSAMSQKFLGDTFDIHGGGMDLMFPHHENELAQSESATGKPFANYWLHNGLTRVNTKKISGSDAATPEGAALLAAVAAKKLIADHGAELLRYLLLSTHYRRPIEFTPEVMASAKKGLATFTRLLDRVERLPKAAASSTPNETVDRFKAKFLDMMDDDFNTAGAIGALHELANEINGQIEKSGVEKSSDAAAAGTIVAATNTFRELAGLLGLLQVHLANESAPAGIDKLEAVMQLVIRLRNEARATKNFALADSIRKGLTDIGITLEDRAGETGWSAK